MKAPVYSSVKWDSSLATCGVILKIKQEDIWKSLAQNRDLIIVFFPSGPLVRKMLEKRSLLMT